MPDTFRVTVNGEEYEVDANSVEEAQAKAQAAAGTPVGATAALAGAETVGEAPEFQREIEVPTGFAGGNIRLGMKPEESATLPFSQEDIADVAPGAGSTLAALLTRSPTGAAFGGAAGETVRMALRKLMGFAPATGIAQEKLGLDPNSPEAMLTNLVMEGAAGGATEGASGLASKYAAPFLEKRAARGYASIFGPKTERVHQEMSEKLVPILGDLPVGSRGRIQSVATKKAEDAGELVGNLYNVPTPASFSSTRRALDDAATKQVRRPATAIAHIDPHTGEVTFENVAADIKNPKLYRALNKRAEAMAHAERQGRVSGQPTTLQDLFEARKAADEMATEKTFTLGKQAKEIVPEGRALKAERTALTREMHAIEPEGEVADAVFSAWKTIESGTKGKDPGMFPVRWVLSRFLPGMAGTTAGFLATKPAFWGSLSNVTKLKVANLLRAGDEVGAAQILRTALDAYAQPETEGVE